MNHRGTERTEGKNCRAVGSAVNNITVMALPLADCAGVILLGKARCPRCLCGSLLSVLGEHFASSKRTLASKLRNRKAHMVAESLARTKRPTTNQGEVWERVDGYIKRADVQSESAAFDDAYTERESTTEEYLTHLQDLDAYGAVVAVNGELIGLDLVDHRETFKKLWAMLLRGYAFDASLDAGGAAQPLTKEAVESWLRTTAAGAHLAPHDLTGEGEYFSVTGDRVAGGVTVHAGRVVHVALFPATAP